MNVLCLSVSVHVNNLPVYRERIFQMFQKMLMHWKNYCRIFLELLLLRLNTVNRVILALQREWRNHADMKCYNNRKMYLTF